MRNRTKSSKILASDQIRALLKLGLKDLLRAQDNYSPSHTLTWAIVPDELNKICVNEKKKKKVLGE